LATSKDNAKPWVSRAGDNALPAVSVTDATGQQDKPVYRNFRQRKSKTSEILRLNIIISQDKALALYFANLASRRRNNGYLSKDVAHAAQNAVRCFLVHLGREITDHALTDLIEEVKEKHAKSDFSIDDALTIFANLHPIHSHRQRGVYVKGIFRVNHCPLHANIDNHFSAKTAKISNGILKAIYDAQDQECKDIMDLQAYAGERIGCLSGKTGSNVHTGTKGIRLGSFKPFNEQYSLIQIASHQTKARYDHICIIPKALADRITASARKSGRDRPFPNCETLWRQITKYALDNHGVRLTSHYLRKRFSSIAQKTPMPTNSWDFLMGDKMRAGHEANVYTLEDWSEIVREYDRYLAPFLSLSNPQDPLQTSDPIRQDNDELTKLRQLVQEQAQQIIQLTKLLTQRLS
jgi:hypothetical protein